MTKPPDVLSQHQQKRNINASNVQVINKEFIKSVHKNAMTQPRRAIPSTPGPSSISTSIPGNDSNHHGNTKPIATTGNTAGVGSNFVQSHIPNKETLSHDNEDDFSVVSVVNHNNHQQQSKNENINMLHQSGQRQQQMQMRQKQTNNGNKIKENLGNNGMSRYPDSITNDKQHVKHMSNWHENVTTGASTPQTHSTQNQYYQFTHPQQMGPSPYMTSSNHQNTGNNNRHGRSNTISVANNYGGGSHNQQENYGSFRTPVLPNSHVPSATGYTAPVSSNYNRRGISNTEVHPYHGNGSGNGNGHGQYQQHHHQYQSQIQHQQVEQPHDRQRIQRDDYEDTQNIPPTKIRRLALGINTTNISGNDISGGFGTGGYVRGSRGGGLGEMHNPNFPIVQGNYHSRTGGMNGSGTVLAGNGRNVIGGGRGQSSSSISFQGGGESMSPFKRMYSRGGGGTTGGTGIGTGTGIGGIVGNQSKSSIPSTPTQPNQRFQQNLR